MKKYLLTLLVIFVILAPNVKAEECTNLFEVKPGNIFAKRLTHSYNIYFSNDGTNEFFLSLEPQKTYTFYLLKDNKLVEDLTFSSIFYDASSTLNVGYGVRKFSTIKDQSSYTLTSSSTSYKISYTFQDYYLTYYQDIFDELNSIQPYLVEGDSVCIPKVDPDPEPDQPVADATLDNFYSIYLDKLGMLVDYTSQNKIILSFIGIILLFVCLEIFLQLFFINGRRRMK